EKGQGGRQGSQGAVRRDGESADPAAGGQASAHGRDHGRREANLPGAAAPHVKAGRLRVQRRGIGCRQRQCIFQEGGGEGEGGRRRQRRHLGQDRSRVRRAPTGR